MCKRNDLRIIRYLEYKANQSTVERTSMMYERLVLKARRKYELNYGKEGA